MTDTTPAQSSKDLQRLDVTHVEGDVYAIDVRGHQLRVDQPLDAGGTDTAPTPTELCAASLATCVAFYAGRYLLRHGLPRTGLSVRTEFAMAADPPARVAAVHVVVTPPPELPEERRAGLLAVASHCTVHNTLRQPPETTVELEPSTPGRRTDESAPSRPSARP
ncbi:MULTISPECIES: OsmC family protein [Streptomyces]|uniref:OsmC family protein n=1 Tax=Streptomyces TaxID=1883 RepID=UPI000F3A8960|nr:MULTISPECIES: OsmC family protein [Streptomyces]AYV33005.1 OsmC-like protein [Streptomyces sp. ADI95-16]WBY24825.1 OsmC family protein [Streptomyces goshikiensis]